jgi:Tat protein secretion system quality control protein TatD with DNase activity
MSKYKMKKLLDGNQIIDTHCHLNDASYDPDRDEVIRRAKDAGLEGIVDIAVDLNSSKKTLANSQKYKDFVFASIGIDMEIFVPGSDLFDKELFGKNQIEIGEWINSQVRQIDKLLEKGGYSMIGECGMDHYWLEKYQDLKYQVPNKNQEGKYQDVKNQVANKDQEEKYQDMKIQVPNKDQEGKHQDMKIQVSNKNQEGKYQDLKNQVANKFQGLNSDQIQKSKLMQKLLFASQIELAVKYKLPLSIHSRGAERECIEIIKKLQGQNLRPNAYGLKLRGSFHSFTGTPIQAKEIVKLGFKIGVNGIVTYKNADNVRDAVRAVGKENIVFETDGPYLVPNGVKVPVKGRNEPSSIIEIKRFAENLN